MPQSKKTSNPVQRYAGIAVVFVIVIGVAILAIVASRQGQSPSAAPQVPAAANNALSAVAPGPDFLTLRGSELHLVSLDGQKSRSLVWPDDVSALGSPLSQISGVDTSNAQPVWLEAGFRLASSTVWRSPDGRREASLSIDRQSGVGSIVIRQGLEYTSLVLRQKNGRRINDQQLLGWTDNDTLAVIGVATSTRVVFALDLNGMLVPLAQLPDDAWLVKVADGSVYYARATPGEGIESAQQPPSSLWQIDKHGAAKQLYESQDKVIQDFLVGNGYVVFLFDDREMEWWREGSVDVWSLGQGRPLLAIDGLGVVCQDQGKYSLANIVDGQVQHKDLNLGQVEDLFYLPQATLNSD